MNDQWKHSWVRKFSVIFESNFKWAIQSYLTGRPNITFSPAYNFKRALKYKFKETKLIKYGQIFGLSPLKYASHLHKAIKLRCDLECVGWRFIVRDIRKPTNPIEWAWGLSSVYIKKEYLCLGLNTYKTRFWAVSTQ